MRFVGRVAGVKCTIRVALGIISTRTGRLYANNLTIELGVSDRVAGSSTAVSHGWLWVRAFGGVVADAVCTAEEALAFLVFCARRTVGNGGVLEALPGVCVAEVVILAVVVRCTGSCNRSFCR